MYLKPRSTTKNPRAMLYRRFTVLEDSYTKKVLYLTEDGKYWLFDAQGNAFVQADGKNASSVVYNVESDKVCFYYNHAYWQYTGSEWSLAIPGTTIELLQSSFGNVAKYQTNRYYYVGSFDYMIKGSVDGSTIQYVKGLITPQSSLNIRTYDDIEVRPDDLIVIGGSLYAVENLEATYKQMPKRFGIYYMTLNNIL